MLRCVLNTNNTQEKNPHPNKAKNIVTQACTIHTCRNKTMYNQKLKSYIRHMQDDMAYSPHTFISGSRAQRTKQRGKRVLTFLQVRNMIVIIPISCCRDEPPHAVRRDTLCALCTCRSTEDWKCIEFSICNFRPDRREGMSDDFTP